MLAYILKKPAVLALLLYSPFLCAQTVNSPISVKLSLFSNSVGLIEPLRFKISITNTSDEALMVRPWKTHAFINAYIRKSGTDEWQGLFVQTLFYPLEMAPEKKVSLPPNEPREVVHYAILSAYELLGSRYKPLEAGNYELRVVYMPDRRLDTPRTTGPKFTSSAAFQVSAYEGIDAEAYEWLKTTMPDYPNFIYNFRVYFKEYEIAYPTLRIAEELIERFPTSRFAPWAKFYLARIYHSGQLPPPDAPLYIPSQPPDYEKSRQILNELLAEPGISEFLRNDAEKLLGKLP